MDDVTRELPGIFKPPGSNDNRRVSRRSGIALRRWCRRLLVVALLGAGALLLHVSHGKWTANSLLRDAARAERLGDLKLAAECLGSYVYLVPDDIEVLARYGVLNARLGASDREAYWKALRILERVISAEPRREDLRLKVAQVALRLGSIPRAKQHLEALLKSAPECGEAESLLGECHIIGKQYEDAAIWFDRACKHDPDRIENYVQLAYILRGHVADGAREQLERKVGRKADQVINDMITVNPQSALAYLERARYRREAGDSLATIEADLDRAYSLAPENVDVILARAGWASDHHRLDEARGYLERGTQRHPTNGVLYRSWAMLELEANRVEAGIRELRHAVEYSPEEKTLPWTFADLLIQAGDPEEADRVVRKLREEGALRPLLLDYLEARLLMQRGEWLTASVLFERASDSPELKGQINYWLSRCYKQLGDLDRQLATDRMLVELEPRSARSRRELGFSLLSIGKVNEAIDQFQAYTRLRSRTPTGWFALARTLIRRQLRLPEQDRDWSGVDAVLDRASAVLPDSPGIASLRAQVLASRREFDRAYRLLKEARDKWPNSLECWIALAGMTRHLPRSEAALAILDEAQRLLGDSVDIRLARGQYYGAHPGPEAPNLLLEQSQHLEAFSEQDRLRLLDRLAVVSYRAGLPAQAERLWGRLAEREPHNLRLRLLLFELAFRAGERSSMERIIREVGRMCEGITRPTRPPRTEFVPDRREARRRLDRLIALEPSRDRGRLVEAYICEVECDQEWGVGPPAGVSIVFLGKAKRP